MGFHKAVRPDGATPVGVEAKCLSGALKPPHKKRFGRDRAWQSAAQYYSVTVYLQEERIILIPFRFILKIICAVFNSITDPVFTITQYSH